MDNIPIDIGIPCSIGCEQFAYFCILTMLKTAKNPARLWITIGIDMHDKDPESCKGKFNNILKLNANNIKLLYIQTNLPHSSLSHSIVLNQLFNGFQYDYGLLCDSDIAYLRKGWDTIFLSKFVHNVKCVGVHTNDKVHLQKFPTLHCVMFHNQTIRDLSISFKPEGTDSATTVPPILPVTEEQCKLYNMQMGDKLRLDTGSELCRKFKENNIDSYYFECCSNAFNNTNKSKFNAGDTYIDNNRTLMTHYKKSSKAAVAFNKTMKKYTITYKPSIEAIKWMTAVIKWLKVTQNINMAYSLDIIKHFRDSTTKKKTIKKKVTTTKKTNKKTIKKTTKL